jgi:multidrug efflux system membrane fusion protein
VSLLLTTETHAVVVPSLAVQAGQQGPFVFVIDAQSQAEMRPVTVARIEGDESVIASGITPGEVVVTDGQLRLTPGVHVAPRGPARASAAGGSR